MIDLSWTVEGERQEDLAETPRPLLSTWHYLRSALRRRWRTVLGLTVVGALLGLGVVVLSPPGSTATVTLLMAHPSTMPGADGSAMDVSLLNTREVASRTVRALGIDVSPESFRSTLKAEPVTTEVLQITLAAPDDASAVARAQELVRQYLDFRAAQLQSLSNGLRSEYTARISAAAQQVESLTRQYEALSGQGTQKASEAFDVLARRTELSKKITDWQETVDDATLQTNAALQSTHVIDGVHADRASTRRAMALATASGAVAGGALGMGIVLFPALVSGRLRRRQDVGIALGAPVRYSVRSGARPRGGRLMRHVIRRGGRWRADDLDVLARGLQSALAGPGPEAQLPEPEPARMRTTVPSTATPAAGREVAETWHRNGASNTTATGPLVGAQARGNAALAAIGNVDAASDVLLTVATRLCGGGAPCFVVDLSRHGLLAATQVHCDITIWRPTGTPELACGPLGAASDDAVELVGSWRAAWDSSEYVLALVEVDPGIDASTLATWVERVVPVVAAGAATAELLSTTGELVREAGLELPFAMMVGCDPVDESLGAVSPAAGFRLEERPA